MSHMHDTTAPTVIAARGLLVATGTRADQEARMPSKRGLGSECMGRAPRQVDCRCLQLGSLAPLPVHMHADGNQPTLSLLCSDTPAATDAISGFTGTTALALSGGGTGDDPL